MWSRSDIELESASELRVCNTQVSPAFTMCYIVYLILTNHYAVYVLFYLILNIYEVALITIFHVQWQMVAGKPLKNYKLLRQSIRVLTVYCLCTCHSMDCTLFARDKLSALISQYTHRMLMIICKETIECFSNLKKILCIKTSVSFYSDQ